MCESLLNETPKGCGRRLSPVNPGRFSLWSKPMAWSESISTKMGWNKEKKWKSYYFSIGCREPELETVEDMARKRYLKKTPLEEARKLFLASVDPSKLASES